jgi:uridine phosphorylase
VPNYASNEGGIGLSEELQPHIRLSSEVGAKYAILPGDPARVDRVAVHMSNVQELGFNREYKSIVGEFKGVKVLVMSTGMGGPSVAIAAEELSRIGVKAVVRIGSCGALKGDLKLGDLVLCSAAVRNEGTGDTYIERGYPAVADFELFKALERATQELVVPYHIGYARSHDSFYTDNEDFFTEFWTQQPHVLGADFETAPLYTVSALRGLKATSILNVVVELEGDLEDSISAYADSEALTAMGEKNEILAALNACFIYENQ